MNTNSAKSFCPSLRKRDSAKCRKQNHTGRFDNNNTNATTKNWEQISNAKKKYLYIYLLFFFAYGCCCCCRHIPCDMGPHICTARGAWLCVLVYVIHACKCVCTAASGARSLSLSFALSLFSHAVLCYTSSILDCLFPSIKLHGLHVLCASLRRLLLPWKINNSLEEFAIHCLGPYVHSAARLHVYYICLE